MDFLQTAKYVLMGLISIPMIFIAIKLFNSLVDTLSNERKKNNG